MRAHLEYNNSVWAPYKISDIDKFEKQKFHKNDTWNEEVQVTGETKKVATSNVVVQKDQGRYDKLLSGVYDDQVSLQLNVNIAGEYYTRGNSQKLTVIRCKYNLRKYCFTNRIVNIWNSLLDDIILA